MEESISMQQKWYGVSVPLSLATRAEYVEIIRQKIKEGPAADPNYRMLFEKLVDPAYKEEKDFLKKEISEYRINLQAYSSPIIQNYLTWLQKNIPQNEDNTPRVLFSDETIDLYIRDQEPSELIGLMESNEKSQQSAIGVIALQEEPYKKLKRKLQEKYQEKKFIERLFYPDDPLLITSIYVNLQIVKEEEQKSKEKHQIQNMRLDELTYLQNETSRDQDIHWYETISAAKSPIQLEALFTESKLQRILIEGRAGAGKSTLCQYIANQWAEEQGKLASWRQRFTWVIWIPLRELAEDNNLDFAQFTLAQYVHKKYLTRKERQQIKVEKLAEELDELIKQKQVLLLLDGYDEIVEWLNSHKLHKEFFEEELLTCSYWVLTSRPYYISKPILKADRQLEVIGFINENIPQYIQQFFKGIEAKEQQSQTAKANTLIQFLRSNPSIWGMSHIPINLELICSIWEEEGAISKQNLTLTQLYNQLVLHIFKRYLNKSLKATIKNLFWQDLENDENLHCRPMLAFLELLAWQGMQQNSLILSGKSIAELANTFYPTDNQQRERLGEAVLKELGLLKGVGITRDSVLAQDYYFVHLTFQEYWAARYIVSCWKKNVPPHGYQDIKNLIATKKFAPRYEIVWWMVAGLLSKESEKLSAFFSFLEEEPKDLTGLNLALLQMRCLEECQGYLDKQHKDIVLARLVRWIDDEITYQRWNFFANDLMLSSRVLKEEPIQKLLESSLNDEKKVFSAIRILVQQVDISSVHAQRILSLLKDSGEGVRSSVVWVLKRQAEHQGLSEALVQHVLSLLRDPTKHVRSSAAQVLIKHAAHQGWRPKALVQHVLSLLKDPIEDIRYFAMQILVKYTVHQRWPEALVQQVISLLKDPNEDLRSSAVRVLVKYTAHQRWPEALVQQVISLLKDPNDDVRYSVVQVLVKHTAHQDRIEMLIKHVLPLLNDPVERVRSSAVRIIVKYAVHQGWPEVLVKHVFLLLNDSVERVRSSVVWVIVNYAVHQGWPEALVKHVISLLKDLDAGVRFSSVCVLVEHVAHRRWPEALVQQVISLFSDPVERVRFSAVQFIVERAAHQGWPEALVQQVLPQVLPLLKDPDARTVWVLIERIARQGLPEALVRQMICLLNDPVKRIKYSAVRVLVEHAAHQGWPETLVKHTLPLLKDPDVGVRSYTMWVLVEHVARQGLPEALAQQVLSLLKDPFERVKFSAVRFLVEYAECQRWPEALVQQMLPQVFPLLKDPVERIKFSAVDILERCEEHQGLPEALVQHVLPLLNDPVERVRFSAVRVLVEHAAHQGWPEALVQHVLPLLKNLKTSYYAIEVLSKLKALPIDVLQAFEATNTSYVLTIINNMPLEALTFSLKNPRDKDQLFPFPRLLLLKCLEQKLPLYFVDNKLFIGQEFQNIFTPIQKHRFVNSFYEVFYKLTGMLSEVLSQEYESFQSLMINAQSPEDNTMEAKTPVNKQVIEKISLKREEIILDVNGIVQAITDQISNANLQKILTDLLKEAQEKQGRFNQSSLKDHTFCQLRDTFINRIKAIMQTVSKGENYKDDEKDVALTQIFPDILFPFWRCRPYQKTETVKDAEQNQQKEQQLFEEQQQHQTQSAFREALNNICVDRSSKITTKPKIYFMYAWPLEEYQLRERGVQPFLQGLHDDLTAAGIEVIFDKEDNFSGNNLNQFMGQILDDNCIVLVFGTESFRHKWFGEKTALQFEGKLLELKWLTDLDENRIVANQKTTIIPWVLTGIRETAIPEGLLPAKNTTVKALYSMNYCEVFTTLLAVAYGITKQAITKYFTHIQLTAHLVLQQTSPQSTNNTNQRMHETASLATTTLFASSKKAKKETTMPDEPAREKNNNIAKK